MGRRRRMRLERMRIRRLYHWTNIWIIWSTINSIGSGKCSFRVCTNVFAGSWLCSSWFLIAWSTSSVMISKEKDEGKKEQNNSNMVSMRVFFLYLIYFWKKRKEQETDINIRFKKEQAQCEHDHAYSAIHGKTKEMG